GSYTRSTNHSTRSLPVSKSSCVTITAVTKTDHSKSSSSFSNFEHFVCSTCHKCVFNANHDACITKLLKEVNSRAKIQSHKTRNSNKPVDQKSHTQKPVRQIFTGHRFSPNKTSVVYEKTSPRSNLRWKPTGTSINVQKKQSLDLSACTSINVQKEQSLDLSAADLIVMSSMIELESLFGPLFDEYFNGENQVVSKSSAITAADASNKRQQQPDSTSSTSILATTVSADGNFNLSYALSWKPCQGDSLNLPDHRYSIYTIKQETRGLDDGVAASFQRSRIHKPHAHTHAFKVNRSTSRSLILNFPTIKEPQTQDDQESQIKMIQVKEMMQDNDLKNSKSKDKGSRSRSQSMNE
ncbi:hypothetical protein Tco_1540906, partial [Tanacetum coccineum]